jgi:SRSO17 transposase
MKFTKLELFITLFITLVVFVSLVSSAYQLANDDQLIILRQTTKLDYIIKLSDEIYSINDKNFSVKFFSQYPSDSEIYIIETAGESLNFSEYNISSFFYVHNNIFNMLTKNIFAVKIKFIKKYFGDVNYAYLFEYDTEKHISEIKIILFDNFMRHPKNLKENLKGYLQMSCSSSYKKSKSVFDEFIIEDKELNTKLIDNYLQKFEKYIYRKESKKQFKIYCLALSSDIPKKNMQMMSLYFGENNGARNLARFMSNSILNYDGMLKCYQSDVSDTLYDPNAMLTVDGCDFSKQGKKSPGVARQYQGSRGKVDNCQASVHVGYASKFGRALLASELFLPERWFSDDFEKLREECHIPKNLFFQTKLQIASRMITDISNSKIISFKYIGVDSFFGRDHDFLDSLPHDAIYFADVPNNQQVFLTRPEIVIPEYKGKGRKPSEKLSIKPISVAMIAKDPAHPWQKWVYPGGAKGPITIEDKCIKVVEVRDKKPGKDVWLYVRKMSDGKLKYALCNESMEASQSAVRIPALMRWNIELTFRDCKDLLGMDQYQLRTWTGWMRHILFTQIVHLFFTKLMNKLSIEVKNDQAAPVVIEPVPLKEYLDAVDLINDNKPINNLKIIDVRKRSKISMTIGIARIWFQQFINKTNNSRDIAFEMMKKNKAAFDSHSKCNIDKMRQMGGT